MPTPDGGLERIGVQRPRRLAFIERHDRHAGANRLVYVDLDRDLGFDQGEPLAVSDVNGVANFPDLAAGDYLIGLAANNAAQILTTSVVPDALATQVSAQSSQAIISASNLRHAWAVSADGSLTPVGTADAGRAVLQLNGSVISFVGSGPLEDGASATSTSMAGGSGNNSGWALVNRGGVQPALVQLDFNSGIAKTTSLQGVAIGERVTGLVRAGSQVYVQLHSGNQSSLALLMSRPMLPAWVRALVYCRSLGRFDD